MSSPRTLPQSLAPRHYSTVNWVGLHTLYMKEVRRFMTVATQTILAPMVTTLLFLAVFVLALGHAVDQVAGEPARREADGALERRQRRHQEVDDVALNLGNQDRG